MFDFFFSLFFVLNSQCLLVKLETLHYSYTMQKKGSLIVFTVLLSSSFFLNVVASCQQRNIT